MGIGKSCEKSSWVDRSNAVRGIGIMRGNIVVVRLGLIDGLIVADLHDGNRLRRAVGEFPKAAAFW